MAGTWIPTSAMFDARWGHTATLLQDGRVLVAGGEANLVGTVNQSAEIYDPQTVRWTRVAPMHDPRWLHTATLLSDGRVLVAGGYAAPGVSGGLGGPGFPQIPVLATAEIFSPATGTWQRVPDMQVSHAEHSALLLRDGRVLVAYGVGDGDEQSGVLSLVALEWFDPAAQSWRLRDRGFPRYAATCTELSNGYLLMFGGDHVDFSQGEGPVYVTELYDQVNDTFGNSIELTHPRAWHTATLLPGGTVLLAGGETRTSVGGPPYESFQYTETPVEERYNPVTGQLDQTASMQQRRHRHTATLLQDGTVLVAGGHSRTSLTGPTTALQSHASSERYQILPNSPPSERIWTQAGNMLDARGGHTATLLNDGTVLVTGGSQFPGGSVLDSAERFFPNVDLSGCRQLFARVSTTAASRLKAMPSRLLRR